MNKNQPAFPQVKTEIDYDRETLSNYPSTYSVGGLTKLEWYAGLAMQGMQANPELLEAVTKTKLVLGNYQKLMATKAFEIAQAMLAESERIQNENKD